MLCTVIFCLPLLYLKRPQQSSSPGSVAPLRDRLCPLQARPHTAAAEFSHSLTELQQYNTITLHLCFTPGRGESYREADRDDDKNVSSVCTQKIVWALKTERQRCFLYSDPNNDLYNLGHFVLLCLFCTCWENVKQQTKVKCKNKNFSMFW